MIIKIKVEKKRKRNKLNKYRNIKNKNYILI